MRKPPGFLETNEEREPEVEEEEKSDHEDGEHEAKEKKKRAQEAPEEQRRVQEAREKGAKTQKEQERQVREAKALEERREREGKIDVQEGSAREVRAQVGHARKRVDTTREGSVEEKGGEAYPMPEENHVFDWTHDVVAKVPVGPNRQRITPTDGTRPSTIVACSHHSSKGNARRRTD